MLYTAWADHFATGEGRTIVVMVANVSGIEDLKETFKRYVFAGEYLIQGWEYYEGIPQPQDNQYIRHYMPEHLREKAHRAEPIGAFVWVSYDYINIG